LVTLSHGLISLSWRLWAPVPADPGRSAAARERADDPEKRSTCEADARPFGVTNLWLCRTVAAAIGRAATSAALMNTIGSWLRTRSWSWGGEPVLIVVAPLRHQRR